MRCITTASRYDFPSYIQSLSCDDGLKPSVSKSRNEAALSTATTA